jgi:hypothetical protein
MHRIFIKFKTGGSPVMRLLDVLFIKIGGTEVTSAPEGQISCW